MKKFIVILCMALIFCFSFVGCGSDSNYEEFEVLSVFTYPVITGKDNGSPLEEYRIGFVYSDNGSPKLVETFSKRDTTLNGRYILIGDTNKYVRTEGYRTVDKYLYLTQETYDSLNQKVIIE